MSVPSAASGAGVRVGRRPLARGGVGDAAPRHRPRVPRRAPPGATRPSSRAAASRPSAPTEVECLEVDGVGWIPEPLSDGTRFTSFGTDPAVEVLVPGAYAPEGLLLPAFAPVAKALPGNGLACR